MEGHSFRGMRFCEELSQAYEFHMFASTTKDDSALTSSGVDQKNILCSKFLIACGNGDVRSIRSFHSIDPTLIEHCDYDGRTPLHVAAAEGKIGVVRYLLSKGANPKRYDRWGQRPINDAERRGNEKIVHLLTEAMNATSSGSRRNSSSVTFGGGGAGGVTTSAATIGFGSIVSQPSASTDKFSLLLKMKQFSSSHILSSTYLPTDDAAGSKTQQEQQEEQQEEQEEQGHGADEQESEKGVDLANFDI